MEGMGGVMSQMPQLPVRLNVDLANNFLPSRAIAPLNISGQMPQPSMGPGMVPISGFGAGGDGAPPPPAPAGVTAGGAGGPAAGSRQLLGSNGAPAILKQDSTPLPFGMQRVLVKQET